MKILHSADWHLDSPIQGHSPRQAAHLRACLLDIPRQVAALAKQEQCDLILLCGDLFDGPCRPETLSLVQSALEDAAIPVFIAPGNHDPMGPGCPWHQDGWPENVHIFSSSVPESVSLPHLDCRVYGAAFQGPESPSLLEGFQAQCAERYALCALHGDPTQTASPYDPISLSQVQESGLDYLALGHIHKGDSFRAGDTLCAWPGCAMGRGFDELGEKGVLIVTLEGGCQTRFVPLEGPRFHWLTASPEEAAGLLPAMGSEDHYRIDLVGESQGVDTAALAAQFPQFPNLTFRDRTVPPLELWANAGSDSLEGVFFQLLRQSDAEEPVKQLAARICRQILLGREVTLP